MFPRQWEGRKERRGGERAVRMSPYSVRGRVLGPPTNYLLACQVRNFRGTIFAAAARTAMKITSFIPD